MTPEEIRALSNEALNRLAAEKGMGWVLLGGWWEVQRPPGYGRYISGPGEYREEKDWNPSTDLNDAWALAENKFFEVVLSTMGPMPEEGAEARVICGLGKPKDISAQAKRPARALTEAVMLAVLEGNP